MYTPMEQVVEVKNKSYRKMGISQVNEVQYVLSVYHSFCDRKAHISRQCYKAGNRIYFQFQLFYVKEGGEVERLCQNVTKKLIQFSIKLYTTSY